MPSARAERSRSYTLAVLDDLKKQPDPRDPRLVEIVRPASSGADAQVAILGLPFDSSIPSRGGARFGPRAFREALPSLTTFDGETDLRETSIADLGDLDLPSTSVRLAHERVEEAAARIFATKSLPFFIGGDNGLTGAILRGLARSRPQLELGLIVIDAHYDVREYESVDTLSSGTPYRRALELPICSGDRTVIVGTRPFANSSHYDRWLRERGVGTVSVDDFDELPAAQIARNVLREIGARSNAIFLSIDIDAVTAGEAPGSSAAAPGGLRSREVIRFVREIAASEKLIGVDLSELSPPWDVQNMTAKLAARLLAEVAAGRARALERTRSAW